MKNKLFFLTAIIIAFSQNIKAQHINFERRLVEPNIGAISDNTYKVKVADFNKDGKLDIIFSTDANDNHFGYYINNGDYDFQFNNISDMLSSDVAIGDLDKDDDIDAVIVRKDYNNNVVVMYKNDGNGVFGNETVIYPDIKNAWHIDVADMNGDNNPDIILRLRENSEIVWLENDGTANFSTQHPIYIDTTNPYLETFSYADADNDGDIDIFIRFIIDDVHKIAWLENDGSGNFSEKKYITNENNESSYMDFYITDLDGDGNKDILTFIRSKSDIVWYKNDGSGNFGEEILIYDYFSEPKKIYATDIDADGDEDIFVYSAPDNVTKWFPNYGQAQFPVKLNATDFFDKLSTMCSGDLDNDGDLELILGSSDTGDAIEYLIPKPCEISNPDNIQGTTTVDTTQTYEYQVNNQSGDIASWYVTNNGKFISNNNYVKWKEIGTGSVCVVFSHNDECSSDMYCIDVNVTATGINELTKENDIVLNPNPAKNKLQLTFNNQQLNSKNIIIYNVFGQIVKQFKTDKKQLSIDISDLQNGVYFLKTGNISKKFIVE